MSIKLFKDIIINNIERNYFSIDKMNAKNTFAPKALASLHKDKVGIKDQRYTTDIVVVSKNHRQVFNWHEQAFQLGFEGLSNLSELGF